MLNLTLAEAGEEMLVLEGPIPREFVRGFAEGTIHYPVPAEFLAGAISESLKVPARVWSDYWERVLLATDDTARLGEIGAPTLILRGSGTPSSHAKNRSGALLRFPMPP